MQNPTFESGISLVKQGFKNVAVTRTFSKFYALAGYRVGYMLADPDVVLEVEKFMSIDNTNIVGAVAATASLQDRTFAQLSLQSNAESRRIVQNALNRILVGREFLPIQSWVRLTLGTPEEMQYFVNVLKEFRKKGWV